MGTNLRCTEKSVSYFLHAPRNVSTILSALIHMTNQYPPRSGYYRLECVCKIQLQIKFMLSNIG